VSRRVVNRRIRLLLFVLVLAFAGTLARAVWLQGVQAASLSRMAASQHRETVVIPAGRGTIFDRTGLQLAIGEQDTTVYANPHQIGDPRAVALAAGHALGIAPAKLYPDLADRSRGFVYLARKTDPAKATALAKQGLSGLGFYPEERRTYPQGTVAAQVLGFAGVDNRGLAGLELQLEQELSGVPGKETIVKDPFGRAIDVISQTPERNGRDVFLTIDHTIQANAELVLRQTVHQWGAKSATAIVLDPHTGAVLAMAVQPGYDANAFSRTPARAQGNHAVLDVYEPGSTFKLVTVAGVLSDGLVTPRTAFTLPYSIRVADRVVHDAERRGTERMTVAHILSHSSNIGAITLAERLGKERLAAWISRFGFGRRTGIDFPGESPGIVLPVGQWSGSTIGNVPIGQGIGVTAIQMASVYASMANHGVWVEPHLVDHVSGGARASVKRRRIVTPHVSAQLVTMLRDVVSEGTGTLAAVPGYTVAGKTGTAQKPDGKGGYSSSRYVASFVGMVPATRPRLVILVMVDEPRGAIWGGVVAAPAFSQIARFDLQYLEVPPDAPATAK
jgi:cell division protein FtsI (penicillin-binding protein 3)/stage V sporulation protein D (sporulation-specific penicillin-binding protein)